MMVNAFPNPARFNVLGVGMSCLTLSTAVHAVLGALKTKRKGYVCVTGVHGVSEAQKDETFRKVLNQSFLNTTDGMPLVWIGKWHRGAAVDRVYGPDLMLEVLKATAGTEFTHFLYGGAPNVADELKHCLEAKCPGVKIVGTYCPPFRPLNAVEEADLIARVRELRPSIIWVGLSTPKQERFMSQYINTLETTLMFGVGAAFDFHSGRVKQAPRWIQRSGLEWLFRMCSEPRRLAGRYLRNNPMFLFRITSQALGLRRYSIETELPSKANA